MLNAVSMENIAVARSVNIDFSSGFNVLTGSTGAGKSLIVTSLGILSGEKFSKELIRTGTDHAKVSGIFSGLQPYASELSEKGVELDEEGCLQISRSITVDGRSLIHINGKTSTISQLKEISSYLISINGQSDSHALSDRKLYITFLDEFAGLETKVCEYQKEYAELLKLQREKNEKTSFCQQQKMLVDLYKTQIREIDAGKLNDPAEEEKVRKLLEKVKSIEKISKYANLVYRALVQNEKGASATYMLDRAYNALLQLTDVMENAEELAAKIQNIKFDLEDIGQQTLTIMDGTDVENPEQQIDLLESRLQTIRKLEKKYGGDVPSVLAYREDIYQKLKLISHADEILEELNQEIKKQKSVCEKKAEEISCSRQKAALRLNREILDTLTFLDMPKVRFETMVLPTELNANGSDEVDFRMSANPGEDLMSMDKIASGGELARVMLSLKCALANEHGINCIVFDEIDTGVSGSTSEKIGLKLKELSFTSQVICVTHSPQIASKSDHHFLIQKQLIDDRTESSVKELNEEERVSEIARIISGISITETQRNAAKDLMN